MSCSTGKISLTSSDNSLHLTWEIPNIVYNAWDEVIRSPYFTCVNRSCQIELSVLEVYACEDIYQYLVLRILDENKVEITADFLDKNGKLVFTAGIKEKVQTFHFNKYSSSIALEITRCIFKPPVTLFLNFLDVTKCCRLCPPKRCLGLYRSLKDSYLNKLYSDFTIVVKEREFEVHKMILAARSTAFSAMMKSDMEESRNNRLTITDCDPDAFHVFLLYLYSESTEEVSTENVTDVYVVADKYGALDLKAYCVEHMTSNMSVDRFCDVLELAAKYDESELIKVLKEYFIKKPREIVTTVDFQSLMKENTGLATEFILLLIPGKLSM